MVEVEMGEDDDVDRLVGEADPPELPDEDVVGLLHPVARAEVGREEGPHPGLEEHPAISLVDEQRAAGEGDPVRVVGIRPPGPERPGRVPEHRPAVEALRVPGHGPQASHAATLAPGDRACQPPHR